jgi:hypothetical protein
MGVICGFLELKFREHRSSLADSMATVVELKDRAALVNHVAGLLAPFNLGWDIKDIEACLTVESYGCNGPPIFDRRTGWHTYLVYLDGYGVLGFTDGPAL